MEENSGFSIRRGYIHLTFTVLKVVSFNSNIIISIRDGVFIVIFTKLDVSRWGVCVCLRKK